LKNIIVAYDKELAIGSNGNLLWKKGEMCNDMRQFRDKTIGNIMIMGRKTLDSIGVALPGRETIVLSRRETCPIPGVKLAHSLDEAYFMAKDYDEIFVVGGGEIYKQALETVDRIFATEVKASISGADTYFPVLDDIWEKTKIEHFSSDENNIYSYSLVTYGKR